jgi:hypothetical protein
MSTRFVSGDTVNTVAPVLTAQAVAVGDIVGLSAAGNVVRAEDTVWNTDLATTQSDFVDVFLGISTQRKTANVALVPGNSAANLIVASTAGRYTAACAATTFLVGDYVGPAKNPASNNLVSQVVAKVATAAGAIGVVTRAGTNLTTVQFDLLSTKVPKALAK